jgi:uncharacterized low-complexity protein
LGKLLGEKTMSDKKVVKPVALAVGAALASTFAIADVANADGVDNPFAMSSLTVGYMLGAGEGSCGGDKEGKEGEGKDGEGSCGEGSCGGDKGESEDKDGEGSCGEGSCGGDKSEGEGSCGGDKEDGEGSCGGDKEDGEGSCGGSV